MNTDKKIKYIAFLDLLGTKNFSGDSDLYFENITTFFKEIRDITESHLKDGNGVAYVASDSAYIESENLNEMITFLSELRNRLFTSGLFFKAALIKGTAQNKDLNVKLFKSEPFIGINFRDSIISDVYLKQDNLKGIGIWVSEEIKTDIKESSEIKDMLVESIYLIDNEKKAEDFDYSLKSFTDIKIDLKGFYTDYEKNMISRLLKACLLAYNQSPKYGRYYLSVFATMINSNSTPELKWNKKNHFFDECPYIFKTILRMAEDSENFSHILGLDYLCFLILDKVFECKLIDKFEKQDIVETFSRYKCISKYSQNTDSIPGDEKFFHSRREFMGIYQEVLINCPIKKLKKKD